MEEKKEFKKEYKKEYKKEDKKEFKNKDGKVEKKGNNWQKFIDTSENGDVKKEKKEHKEKKEFKEKKESSDLDKKKEYKKDGKDHKKEKMGNSEFLTRKNNKLFDENKKLTEEITRIKKDMTDSTEIVAFLKKMNYTENSRILDNLLLVEENIYSARKNEVVIPSELESSINLLLSLSKFIKNSDVRYILPIGKELEIGEEDLENYSYSGTPFAENEKKKVKVVNTGWQYKSEIISRPSVEEIK